MHACTWCLHTRTLGLFIRRDLFGEKRWTGHCFPILQVQAYRGSPNWTGFWTELHLAPTPCSLRVPEPQGWALRPQVPESLLWTLGQLGRASEGGHPAVCTLAHVPPSQRSHLPCLSWPTPSPSPSWASYQPSVTPAETFHSSVRAQPGAVSKPSTLPGRRQRWVSPGDEREGPGAHLAGSTPTQLPFALSPVTHLSLPGQLVPEWVCEVSSARHSGPHL